MRLLVTAYSHTHKSEEAHFPQTGNDVPYDIRQSGRYMTNMDIRQGRSVHAYMLPTFYYPPQLFFFWIIHPARVAVKPHPLWIWGTDTDTPVVDHKWILFRVLLGKGKNTGTLHVCVSFSVWVCVLPPQPLVTSSIVNEYHILA
jgi:hypothetical protein